MEIITSEKPLELLCLMVKKLAIMLNIHYHQAEQNRAYMLTFFIINFLPIDVLFASSNLYYAPPYAEET